MKVIVVGAGPAGLAIGLGLAARGVEVTVLEAAPEPGGRMRTVSQDGYSVELGPAGILDDAAETRALLESLGSDAPTIVRADPVVKRRYVVRGGRVRAIPTSPPALLFGSTLSLSERLALLREPFVPRGRDPQETVAAFARRRFGASLAEAFAQPIVVGVFGGDYEALELASAFPRLAALEAEHGSLLRGLIAQQRARRGAPARLMSFRGGMGALPRALAARLGERLRLGVTVEAIEAGPRVRLADGSTLAADHVVLATAPEAAARLTGVDPPLHDRLAAIPSAAIASVSLGWPRAAITHPLDGFGLLCPRREGYKTIGVLFMTSIFPDAGLAPPGQVLLRVMMGGPNDPAIDALDDATIVATARRELDALLGVAAPPSFTHLQRWPRAIAQYTVGHGERTREVEARAGTLGLSIAGTALHGVGVNDVIRDAAHIVERIAR